MIRETKTEATMRIIRLIAVSGFLGLLLSYAVVF